MEVMPSTLLRAGLLFAGAAVLSAFSTLNQDQLKMLQDSGGWDYLKMTDTGMQTDHSCFDGKFHPETCSGRLTFSDDNKFTQVVKIEGQEVPRHGTYTLEDDQLALFDELGTRDGPYTIQVDTQTKALVMDMPQVHIELILHKSLREKKRKETK
jgi:hypothetical protein